MHCEAKHFLVRCEFFFNAMRCDAKQSIYVVLREFTFFLSFFLNAVRSPAFMQSDASFFLMRCEAQHLCSSTRVFFNAVRITTFIQSDASFLYIFLSLMRCEAQHLCSPTRVFFSFLSFSTSASKVSILCPNVARDGTSENIGSNAR